MEFDNKKDILLSKGKQVFFYSIPNNPECRKVREILTLRGVSFTEIDVTQSAYAAEDLLKKMGGISAPVLEIGGLRLHGFDEKRISNALSVLTKEKE